LEAEVKITYTPLLQIQRDLHGLPRNRERFLKYLRTIGSRDGNTLELPSLLIMNPMGREHVTAHLDALLAMDADTSAAQAVADAELELAAAPGEFKAALVIADDLKGGWTNRFATEHTLRFPKGPAVPDDKPLPRWAKDFWITGVVWSSETPTEKSVREAILTAVYRIAYLQVHGCPQTLRDKLAQEGAVMAKGGCTEPVLDEDDIDYTREVIRPFLDTDDMRTAIECLFGDAAGATLGFTPRGLIPWAGLALALHDALSKVRST
jgi:hypothetical protein